MPDSTQFATDIALWNAFREGDVRAFEQIYRAHAEPLMNYGKRISSDVELVADAVQDVFLEIWKRRATLTTPNTIRFYLFRILRNRLVGHLTRTTDPLYQAGDLTDVDGRINSPSLETLLTELDTQQHQQVLLRRAIESLPPRQQEALVLAYYHQFSNEEVAQVMGINPQSVTNHISRAILALRQLLNGTLWTVGWMLINLSRQW
ncbi:sigma-70 family RNA polymerase sigma factor [Fibrisoma montanum]|uniref:Sigma-70 family RNA polymerase sigma factor n=1 Tax=Fibrisoma montanum TaxID=2305895 RepID=A0A418LZH1_9BACT|nr:sigma-70 family RNA polymerase sigma factor [Fibrisoma montanum]RIV18659.1 sigma-70 family RNA polymerase sigma factor [Fibrisoma montanum]